MRSMLMATLIASLPACATQPTDPTSNGSGSDGGGLDLCPVEPTTSVAHADFGSPSDAWLGEPIVLYAGWTVECSAPACDFAGYGTCVQPSAVDVQVTTTGVATDVELRGNSESDPAAPDGGSYKVFNIVPSAAGTVAVHVVDDNVDLVEPFVSDQTFTIRQLDDLALACRGGGADPQPIDCGAIASGEPFSVTFAGLSAGQSYVVYPKLTFDTATPTQCFTGGCTFGEGVTQPLTVTAELAGVTRTLAIAAQLPSQ